MITIALHVCTVLCTTNQIWFNTIFGQIVIYFISTGNNSDVLSIKIEEIAWF